jgi:hypothetical protein
MLKQSAKQLPLNALPYARPLPRPGNLALANITTLAGIGVGIVALPFILGGLFMFAGGVGGTLDIGGRILGMFCLLFGIFLLYIAARLLGAVHRIYNGSEDLKDGDLNDRP